MSSINKKEQLQKAVQFIVEECKKEGIVVHQYNAQTSNSVYLKFDWGLANSLRISDHKGLEKYHYRFNLILGLPKIINITYRNNGYSTYYPFKEILKCVCDIISNRKKIIEKHGLEKYKEEMDRVKNRIERLPKEKLYPFWKYGKRV